MYLLHEKLLYACCKLWISLWSVYLVCLLFILSGLETFSQLVYEDEYGAVSLPSVPYLEHKRHEAVKYLEHCKLSKIHVS